MPSIVTITVINRPPVANPDIVVTCSNVAISATVATNDSDPDGNLNPTSYTLSCGTCYNVSNGTLSLAGNGSYTYTPNTGFSGTDYFVYQVCDNGSLCDTALVTIIVNALPVVSAGSSVSICIGGSTTLAATAGLTSYSWSPSTGLSCSTCASTSASPVTTTTYTVTGTNSNGCVNTASVTVTVNSLPTISAGSAVSICNGSSTTIAATAGLTSYSWYPSTGLSCSTCASTSASPVTTTTYTVTGTNSNGCVNTSSVTVTVNPLPYIEPIFGLSSVCIGASVNLVDATPGGSWYATNGNATVVSGTVTGVHSGLVIIQYTVSNSWCSVTENFPIDVSDCNCCH